MIMNYQLLEGDCLETMKTLPANSVQTCVTSPPYYGLRDYGTAEWVGGDVNCDHEPDKTSPTSTLQGGKGTQGAAKEFRRTCPKCGAERVDSQIGLEETPEAYAAKLVEVFREVRRLLRDDGTLWLNLGDSYNGSGGPGGWADNKQTDAFKGEFRKYDNPNRNVAGLKPKDLIGVPWMVAFALRADGWYLRSDIIWAKPNPMPESVKDRPTKSHEYIFLLSKSREYFYDADAIREEQKESSLERLKRGWNGNGERGYPNGVQNHLKNYMGKTDEEIAALPGRNRRSVWTVNTQSYDGAHFATYPTKLVDPCILAGTSAHGSCAVCGAPWERIVDEERTNYKTLHYANTAANGAMAGGVGKNFPDTTRHTVGWQPTCTCNANIVPCTVLDPFNGSGTTGAVALKHGRNYIGCELNPDYIKLAHQRIQQSQPMLFPIG